MRAMQFAADAQKARIDSAERKAMRRMIKSAPLPPQIKQALLQHSRSVQFADDGREIPSVPLKWTTDAAVAVQFGYGPLNLNNYESWPDAVRPIGYRGTPRGPHDNELLERLRQNAALDDPNGPEVQLPDFLRGEGDQAWPEGELDMPIGPLSPDEEDWMTSHPWKPLFAGADDMKHRNLMRRRKFERRRGL